MRKTNETTQHTIVGLDPQRPDQRAIERAASELRSGGILIFPTDTVYGLGLLMRQDTQPADLYDIKKRSPEKAVPLLISSIEDLQYYGSGLPQYAEGLAKEHWPGALTLVVCASEEVPPQFVAKDGSIALRMPANTIALELIKAAGAPLATSSANLSGNAPACSVGELNSALVSQVNLVIDGGSLLGGKASTVVSCLSDEPRVLRPGPIDF